MKILMSGFFAAALALTVFATVDFDPEPADADNLVNPMITD